MFGLGVPELAIIGFLALIIFGPSQLPKMGKMFGETVKGLKQSGRDIQKALEDDDDDDKE